MNATTAERSGRFGRAAMRVAAAGLMALLLGTVLAQAAGAEAIKVTSTLD